MITPFQAIMFCGGLIISNFAFAQTWTQTGASSNQWYSLASSADGFKLVAVANPGSIYTSADSGATWMLTSAPSNTWSSVASSADGSNLVAAGGGSVFTSVDSGVSWNSNSVPWIPASTNPVFVASSTDGSNLLAAAQKIGLFTSTNGGRTWTSNNVIAKLPWIFAASSADGTKLWAVSDSGPNIWVSTNSGRVWTSTTAFNSNWREVAPTADGNRLAGVNYGWGIYISTNSGMSWTKTSGPVINGQNWQAVASSATGSNLVASAGALFGSYGPGPIYTSTNSGASWVSNSAPSKRWASVASSADGSKLVAVANGGGIYTLQTTPSPKLNITLSRSDLTVSWVVPSTDFVLQHNMDLSTTIWTTLTNRPTLNPTTLQNEITLPLNSANNFYRLANP